MDSLIGRVLGNGRYRIDSELSRGGQGTVYRGTHLALNIPVAIKVLGITGGQDRAAIARFEREARRSAQLRHPNIVVVHDFAFESGLYYIVSEFVEGEDLRTLMKRRAGPLPTEDVLACARQIGSALQYAHARDTIHRDIKPSNVLLEARDGRAVLCDFGLARLVEAEEVDVTVEVGGAPGTPSYMSPEQCLDLPLDGRTDIYSLALVIYEMLTGAHPFRGENDTADRVRHKQIHDPPPSPRDLGAKLNRQAEAVLLKALAKSPDDRYASAGEFVDALSAALIRPRVRIAWRTPRLAVALPVAGVALIALIGLLPPSRSAIRGLLTRPQALSSPTATATSQPTAMPLVLTATLVPRAPTQPPTASNTPARPTEAPSATVTPGVSPSVTASPTATLEPTARSSPTPEPRPTTAPPQPITAPTVSGPVRVRITGLEADKLACITLVFKLGGQVVGRTAPGSATEINGPACDEIQVDGDSAGKCPWSTHSIVDNPVKVAGSSVTIAFSPIQTGGGGVARRTPIP